MSCISTTNHQQGKPVLSLHPPPPRSFHTEMTTLAEMTPLSTASHSSTLLQPNLRHVTCEAQPSSFRRTNMQRRVIRLTFAQLLGRNCFSFGSSRSNDYQLPLSDEVAPHHFIMFFDLNDSTLYIRSTCSQGILISSDSHEKLRTEDCDTPIAIVPSMRLQIGTIKPLVFEIATYTSLNCQDYAAELVNYSTTIGQHTLISSISTLERREQKKRRASITIQEGGTTKRQRCAEPMGCFSRITQALLWAVFWE